MPIRAVGIEIGPLESIVDHMEEDELLREHAGVATMRCPEDMVLRDARAVAESIRWDLGLEDGDGRYHGFNVPVPRAGTGGPP